MVPGGRKRLIMTIQFTMKALFDEETRKQIREAVLGEARSIARSAVDLEINKEIKRIGTTLFEKYVGSGYNGKPAGEELIRGVIRDMMTQTWNTTRQMLLDEVKKQIEAQIAQKMKTLTVWSAESQDAYVRKTAREEIRRMIKVDD